MKPTKLENKCLYNSDMNLWEQCDVVNLVTNFRVGDSTWNETLQRIRFGEQTDDDLALLKTRYTSNFDRTNWDDCLHAFYSKKECFAHNTRVLNNLKTKFTHHSIKIPYLFSNLIYIYSAIYIFSIHYLAHISQAANLSI